MNRRRKIELLKNLEKGDTGALKELLPVSFVILKSYSNNPGIYWGSEGEQYNKEEVDELVKEKKRTSSIVWVEIKMQDDKNEAS